LEEPPAGGNRGRVLCLLYSAKAGDDSKRAAAQQGPRISASMNEHEVDRSLCRRTATVGELLGPSPIEPSLNGGGVS